MNDAHHDTRRPGGRTLLAFLDLRPARWLALGTLVLAASLFAMPIALVLSST